MDTENLIKQQLLELEELLLQPKIRKSPDELSNILADEFREIGSSGKIFSKEQIIEELQQESSVQMSINNFQINELASNVFLAKYKISKKNEAGKQVVTSLRSSIWKRIDGKWQMLFHQGTLIKTAL